MIKVRKKNQLELKKNYIYYYWREKLLRNKGVKYSTKKVEHGHMGIAHQNEILRFTATEEIQQNGQNRRA